MKAHIMPSILLINGPNLNLLGERETAIYGKLTLADLVRDATDQAQRHGLSMVAIQSNHEGELIDAIHRHRHDTVGLIINAGGYTHSSVAIHDALKAYPHPKIELHLSNIYAREPFRHHSYLSPAVDGMIAGLGAVGYRLAVDGLAALVEAQS